MTREKFIEILDREGHSYKIEGDKIVVTDGDSEGNFDLYLGSIPSDVIFRNDGWVWLRSLTSLPPGVEFRNGGRVSLESLTSLPPGVMFNNGEFVNLKSLIGGWFSFWKGNIEGIDGNRLLNKMVADGLFDRR
jgi:hypothetical protein